MSGTGRFVRHLSVNALLYVAIAVAFGTPAIAVFIDLFEEDGSAVVAGFWSVLIALSWFSWVIVVHLGPYLALVYWARRRVVAALLSPLAVGILFGLAGGPFELAVLLAGGLVYALSLDLPGARPPWWRDRRLTAAAAAAWLVSLGTVELVQRASAGVQTDVTVAADGVQYRLACEYDRAGRVLRSVRRPGRLHPGGVKACVALEEAARSLREGPGYLQRGCPGNARRGRVEGEVAGRPFRETIIVAACEEDTFVGFERDLVVPAGR